MWLRRLLGNVSLPWLLAAVALCVAAFVVGVMTSGSSDGPLTAEERTTPQSVEPPTPTPSAPVGPTPTPLPTIVPHVPPPPTAEELRRIRQDRSGLVEYLVGTTTAGSVIKFSNGKILKLPNDVYVSGKARWISCAEGRPCPKMPIYNINKNGVSIALDGDGNLIPGSDKGVDLTQFSFINDIKDSP